MSQSVFILALVAAAVIVITIPGVHGDTCDACECKLTNVDILSQLIDERIDASVNANIDAKVSTTITELISVAIDRRINESTRLVNESIPEIVDARLNRLLRTQPVIKMMYIAIRAGLERTVIIRDVDQATLDPEDILSTLTILDYSRSYHSVENILAYYPNFTNSYTAILFVNLEAVIPCLKGNHLVSMTVCHLFSFEEDNFQQGRPFIQALDVGNHFRVFSNKVTFGFGVFGCATFDPECVSTTEVMIVCLLPRDICG